MDATGELAQLPERDVEALRQAVDQGQGVGVTDARAQDAQLQREGQELLLSPVVQVALDTATCLVGRLHDAQARHAQLLQARAQIGAFLQPDRQSRIIDVCGAHPCYSGSWTGP